MRGPTPPFNLKLWAVTWLVLAIVIAVLGLVTSNAEWSRLSTEFGVGAESRTFLSLQEPPSTAGLQTHCEQAVVEFLERQEQISDSLVREYLHRWRTESGITAHPQPGGMDLSVVQPLWQQKRTTFGRDGLLTQIDTESGEAGRLNKELFALIWKSIEEKVSDQVTAGR